jgi:hypothetical protein
VNPYRSSAKEEVIPFKRTKLSKLRRWWWRELIHWKGKFLERKERCKECQEDYPFISEAICSFQ